LIIHCNSSYFSLSRYAFWVTIMYKALEINIKDNIGFFYG